MANLSYNAYDPPYTTTPYLLRILLQTKVGLKDQDVYVSIIGRVVMAC